MVKGLSVTLLPYREGEGKFAVSAHNLEMSSITSSVMRILLLTDTQS